MFVFLAVYAVARLIKCNGTSTTKNTFPLSAGFIDIEHVTFVWQILIWFIFPLFLLFKGLNWTIFPICIKFLPLWTYVNVPRLMSSLDSGTFSHICQIFLSVLSADICERRSSQQHRHWDRVRHHLAHFSGPQDSAKQMQQLRHSAGQCKSGRGGGVLPCKEKKNLQLDIKDFPFVIIRSWLIGWFLSGKVKGHTPTSFPLKAIC